MHRLAMLTNFLLACMAAFAMSSVHATEGAGGMYLLGSQALGAGNAPPPGWYLSTAMAQYSGKVGSASVGGVTLLYLKKRVDSMGVNLLYAPQTRIFGAQAAFSVTVPYAYLRLTGETTGRIEGVHSVSNTDVGDTAFSGRLGWKLSDSFSHAVAVIAWAPTGEYTKGFNASIGHNRWAFDLLWSMTYVSPTSHLELSGAIGYGVNGVNPVTHYRSGNEAHVELAVGKRLSPHWVVGLAGYGYRQVSPDDGSGDRLGGLQGRVFGAGPAVNYGTRLGTHAITVGVRYYREFGAVYHFHGDVAMLSATLRL
ncbi:SphA family protein [Dyella telluris]|uniref:Transporter n=1 Tax=Dyella telluris TaxID=2763498 RepID=A0A7G8PZZ6_9GAMM|nr:transporter [Dyella telluris]QNK00104.1 transporter [Dyella telluris]